MWEDQRIVSRPRYRDLVAGLQFVARQELIFGIHVHIGLDDPDKAIHVVNGMRVHLPLLLALSANSPFWRADQTGLLSTRTPIFRAFPRVGIPPRYDDFEDWSKRIRFMIESRVISDYTYLWYDVRPHPNFGTVEVRVMDSQTRVEHTVALAAMVQAMVKELAEHYEAGKRLSRYPYEMLDENKWLAARHGLDAGARGPAEDGTGPRPRPDAPADGPAAAARRGPGLGRGLRLSRGHPRPGQRRARSWSTRRTTTSGRWWGRSSPHPSRRPWTYLASRQLRAVL